MNIKREFIFSCEHFGGFKASININDCEIIDDILRLMKNKLRESLIAINLKQQITIYDNIQSMYHIHDYSIEHMLLYDGPYYICNVCPNQNRANPSMDYDFDIEDQIYNIALQE